MDSASIRDRAHLNTTGTTSEAWLRAIPNLGLSMSQHKFLLAVKVWLGIPIFPTYPQFFRCACGQIIDQHGDHLLGCGNGPLWIKQHDTLRDTIWHALLMDNKEAVHEQHCGESNNRPGDIYHPDFMLGKPAYFDVSVWNSLQPHNILRAAVVAGVANEVGEIEKDERYEQEVVDTGGNLFPLVVKTLGLWPQKSSDIHRFQGPIS